MISLLGNLMIVVILLLIDTTLTLWSFGKNENWIELNIFYRKILADPPKVILWRLIAVAFWLAVLLAAYRVSTPAYMFLMGYIVIEGSIVVYRHMKIFFLEDKKIPRVIISLKDHYLISSFQLFTFSAFCFLLWLMGFGGFFLGGFTATFTTAIEHASGARRENTHTQARNRF